MQWNQNQQPVNPEMFQLQQSFSYMSQPPQQLMFPSFVPFPNNVIVDEKRTDKISSNNHYMFSENNNNKNNSSQQYQWQNIYPQEGENNKISYEINRNQQQYASYPPDSIYRRASGPGWQQQQIFYPPNSFK